MLIFNKVNPKLKDGVEIIKCIFQNLKDIPVSLSSMEYVIIEAVYFLKITHSKEAGSVLCSSCNTVKLNKICGQESISNYTSPGTEEDSNSNFIKIKNGKFSNLVLTSMIYCQSSNNDCISIFNIEMNITSSNFTNNKSRLSTLRLQNTKITGICTDNIFANNIAGYERALKYISMEQMSRCIYNSQKMSQCSIRFHQATSAIYDCIIRGSNSGKAIERHESYQSSCSLYRCNIVGTTHDFVTVKEKLVGTIAEFTKVINCQEYEGNLNNLISNENCFSSNILLAILFSFLSPVHGYNFEFHACEVLQSAHHQIQDNVKN